MNFGIKTLVPVLAAGLAAAWSAPGNAQNYPNKPIKMIVPISVGSITDVAARMTAHELEARLGQPVVVINKPGASMVLGGNECAKSDPDGYTLCVVSPDTMSFNPLTIPNLPYNPDKDFVPVIDMYHVIEGLMVPAGSHINSIDELRAKAVAEPGKLNYGTLGERTTTDAFRQWLGDHWKTSFVAIPYKGGAEIIAALLGRHHRRHQNRRRQHDQPVEGGQDQGAGAARVAPLAGAPRCPDLRRSGLRRFPRRSDLLGPGGSNGHAGSDRQALA